MKKLSLMIAGLLASSQLHALGIGEAQLHSHIGERLDITVPLYLDANELAAIQQLRATIGDRAMFERMHLEYRDTLRQMQIVVEQQGRNAQLRIQSDTRISEPMVEFPLDVSLSGSRLVRTVTLLLDPPPLQVAAPTSRPAPLSRPSTARPAPTTSVPARRTTVTTGSATITAKRDGEYYGPIAVSQTLGEIAQVVRPDGANLHQTLVALWELNPDAFIGNNMNRLMAGSTLRIPDREKVLAINPAEARRQVVAQYQQTKTPTTAARPTVTESVPARPVATTARPETEALTPPVTPDLAAETAPSEEARLSLLAPSNIEQIPEIFQEEVKLLGDQLRGLNAENTELRERIGELERHISTLSQQMVALAENTLALSGAEEERIAQLLAQMESDNQPLSRDAIVPQVTPATDAALSLAAESLTPTDQIIERTHLWRYAVIGGVLLLSVGVAGMWFRRLRQRERYRDVMYRI